MTIIRAETTQDYPVVRRVNKLAFDRSHEADLVDALRAVVHPYVSLVAVKHGQVVGHIFFSPVLIESNDVTTALGLAPMGVLPEHQKQGIGSQLVREGLKACQRIGCNIIVVLGHPEYYPRFGFVPARQKGLYCEYPVPDEVFMVVEMTPGALGGQQGLVKYHPEFGNV